MSDFKYEFRVSIGFPSAERSDVFDLVDDLGYDLEDLKDPDYLESVLERELEDWQWQYIETWTEKQ